MVLLVEPRDGAPMTRTNILAIANLLKLVILVAAASAAVSIGCASTKPTPWWGLDAPSDSTVLYIGGADSIGVFQGGKLHIVYTSFGCHESASNGWDSCKVYRPGQGARIVEGR